MGKIRGSDLKPKNGLNVRVYKDERLLGSSITDNDGFFDVSFAANIKGIPNLNITDASGNSIYIVLEDLLKQRHHNQVLRRILKEKLETEYDIKEIEYQIITYDGGGGEHKADPSATDTGEEYEKQLGTLFDEVGEVIDIEQAVNLNHLSMEDMEDMEIVVDSIRNSIQGYAERRENFLDIWRRLASLFEAYIQLQLAGHAAEWGEILYDYDGPQVPPKPRNKDHHDVIMWPREEE